MNRSTNQDEFYGQALDELSNKTIDKPTFARAFADAEGDENKTRSLYIKYRVQALSEKLKRESNRDFSDFITRYPKIRKLSRSKYLKYKKQFMDGLDNEEEIEKDIKMAILFWRTLLVAFVLCLAFWLYTEN